jgi:hypothetical protein
MEFTRTELRQYDTIEQSHSGDELKIDNNPSMQQPRTFTCLSKSIYKIVNIT